MIRYWILDENRKPVEAESVLEWANWFETSGLQRVFARDEIGVYFNRERVGTVTVSTVFLGVSSQVEPLDHPRIWETMVFFDGDEIQLEEALNEEFKEEWECHADQFTCEKDAMDHHRSLTKFLTEAVVMQEQPGARH